MPVPLLYAPTAIVPIVYRWIFCHGAVFTLFASSVTFLYSVHKGKPAVLSRDYLLVLKACSCTAEILRIHLLFFKKMFINLLIWNTYDIDCVNYSSSRNKEKQNNSMASPLIFKETHNTLFLRKRNRIVSVLISWFSPDCRFANAFNLAP